MSNERSKDTDNWLDFTDPKQVAYGLGKVAAAIGVGTIVVKGGKRLFIAYGDHRTQAKGLISIGELEQNGAALSVAAEQGALEGAGVGRDWFAMGSDDGFNYPGEDPTHGTQYLRTARKLWEMVKDHLPSPASDAAQDQRRTEKE